LGNSITKKMDGAALFGPVASKSTVREDGRTTMYGYGSSCPRGLPGAEYPIADKQAIDRRQCRIFLAQ
jgi:hypothetical protein